MRQDTDVHRGISRYLEWAQDTIVASLAIVLLADRLTARQSA